MRFKRINKIHEQVTKIFAAVEASGITFDDLEFLQDRLYGPSKQDLWERIEAVKIMIEINDKGKG